ncbi:MAG: C10 family peptidase [Bacteroidales bacterium]|nr:C10 family peptidase [Bacteroidales bacterium]
MKHFLLSLVLIIVFFGVFAKKVDVETAQKVAKNVYYIKANNLFNKSFDDIQLSWVYTEYFNNEPVYYVFNVNQNEGFVIISADDIAKPIIGYSFEGPYPLFNQPPQFSEWMNGYKEQIVYAKSNNIKANSEIQNEWNNLLVEKPLLTKEKAIQPLLLHTWNQDWPWNAYCPVDANGPGGHVYAGCVAVSMAQLMKYYNYPNQGTGSHTNYSIWNGGYGNLTINYGTQTYNWYSMPNIVNTTNYNEVAKLLYHCSVAVDMNYGPDGSGSQTSKIATALKTYYFYSTNIQYVQKSSYSDANWKNLLKQQIDNKWPMAYQGSDGTSGHAWNCDGYNGDQFHMNWGWSGSANGYYDLSSLVAGGYDLTQNQGAVINVYPANNYPEFCSGTKNIIGRAGAFNDGSGNQNYLNNQDCKYLIQPECANSVSLSFDRFELGNGDHVYVYDGTSTADSLLADYTNSNLPGTTILNSSGSAMLIRFVTDGSDNNLGWYASYTTTTCQGTKYLTDVTGTVEDGSKTCDYDNSKICTWYLQPANATAFTLNFQEFDFPSTDQTDNLKIYKNSTVTSNLIGTYTSANVPPSTLDIQGASKVIVKFTSNSTTTAGGFKLTYNTTLTGIENNLIENKVEIFPNPFINDATIKFSLNEQNNNVKISLENIIGKTIGNYETTMNQGDKEISLSTIIQSQTLTEGLYFVRININNKESVYKLIHQ